nr:unnamed protein product [Callosobruchus chinensis]
MRMSSWFKFVTFMDQHITQECRLAAVSRKCGEAVETAKHGIFDCPALCRRRSSYLEVVQEERRQIRLSLEYCSHIWEDAAPTTLYILDAVQRRAIRLIGDWALTCLLQSLSLRRAIGDLSLFY